MHRNPFCAATAAILLATGAWPQTAQTRKPDLQTTAIRIIPLIGDNAVNNIALRTTIEPVVEVRDQNDRPVEGAEVTFELPQAGSGASFPDQTTKTSTRTNAQGQAAASGMRANSQTGPFRIKVTAEYAGLTANYSLAQRNSTEISDDKPRTRSRRWLWISGIAGAAAVGTIIAVAGGSSSTATQPAVISVNPGAVSVGAPR